MVQDFGHISKQQRWFETQNKNYHKYSRISWSPSALFYYPEKCYRPGLMLLCSCKNSEITVSNSDVDPDPVGWRKKAEFNNIRIRIHKKFVDPNTINPDPHHHGYFQREEL